MAARRVILPSADDLFRPTAKDARAANGTANGRSAEVADPSVADPSVAGSSVAERAAADPTAVDQADGAPEAPVRKPGRPSGRVRHDEKMTVYITSEELLEIEHARLALRRTHGLAVDRGRLVREAVAIVLADLEANGGESALVRRLTDEGA